MPIISSSSSSTTAPQKAELKPIGICLPSNSSIDMSNSSTTLATNRVTTSQTNANYYNSSSSSSTSSAAIPVGALSVMVARFAADANSRQQTVILHPRPLSAANRSGLQMSASIRGPTVISGQNINTTSSTPSLSSSSASISVRTTHLIGGQQHPTNALPVLNLSTVTNANTSGVSSHSSSTVKQICGQTRPFITTSGPLPIESVSLVMANANEPNVVNARPLRLHNTSNDLKQNTTTVHNINKISGSRTAVMTGSTIVATQPTKMISIGGSGGQTATSVAQHVARVGIIGQLPGVTSNANKSGIINLATTSLSKGFIINSSPTTNLNTGNATIHNVVNVSGSMASFGSSAQSLQSTKLSVNSTNNNIITTRHSVVSTQPFISQQSGTNVSQPSLRSTIHQNANTAINSLQSSSQSSAQQLLQPTTTVSTTSPLRPTILSSPANSPIKQTQLQTSTPSSPRPSILIRKRIANDSQTSLTPTTLFKTSTQTPNTAITASSTPLRVSNIGLNSNELSLGQTNAETRTNESYASSDATLVPNCVTSLPTTPNSEGNQTPRKKPRKQLLEPSSLKSSQNIQLLNSSANKLKTEDNSTDKESALHLNKKPRVSLLSSYNMQWKALQYHFLRYSDVRPKPEKKLTLSELSNEGLQRKNGWKIHHLATQMEVMTDNELNVHQRLTQFLDTFEKDVTNQCSSNNNSNIKNINNTSVCDLKHSVGGGDSSFDTIAIKLNDLIRGNLQRSNLFSDQITEARQLIIKLTNDHKERVAKITKKCANKRTYCH
jgi:hypothetical protein